MATPRDTSRIEKILEGFKSTRMLVREEMLAGSAHLEQIALELENHERLFAARLLELREHNARAESNPDKKTESTE